MSAPDWKLLTPQAPLKANDARLVERTDTGGLSTVPGLVESGRGPIAVVGPPGVGKSSGLAQVMRAPMPRRNVAACLLDHSVDDTHTDASAVFVRMLGALFGGREVSGMDIPAALRERWKFKGAAAELGRSLPKFDHGADLFREVAEEVTRQEPSRRVTAFIDGLERRDDDLLAEVLESLRRMLDLVDVVVVVAPRVVLDPQTVGLLDGFRVVAVQPVPVSPEHSTSWREGREFLASIVRRRLALGGEFDPRFRAFLDRAAEASGGVPRVYLQLVQDAGFYAEVSGRAWPEEGDLRQAMGDQITSLRRLLQRGDLDALRAAKGTGGLKVELSRRIRFLSHGLLLEYGSGEATRVFPAPLLEALLLLRSAA